MSEILNNDIEDKLNLPELQQEIKESIYDFAKSNSFQKLREQQRKALENPLDYKLISAPKISSKEGFFDFLLEDDSWETDPERFLLNISVYCIRYILKNEEILKSDMHNDYVLAVLKEILKWRNIDKDEIVWIIRRIKGSISLSSKEPEWKKETKKITLKELISIFF